MPKKSPKYKIDPSFKKLRKKLPHNYMQELSERLPDVPPRKIQYAMEKRCQDMELKEKVAFEMTNFVKDIQERMRKIKKLPAEV